MYTFHLWVVLLESLDSEMSELLRRLPALRAAVLEKFSGQIGDVDPITIVNGLAILQMSLCRNHRGDSHAALLQILEKIARELPGSYGLIYWRDDEDPAVAGSFQVIALARGQLQHRTDPFLSPLSPVVED